MLKKMSIAAALVAAIALTGCTAGEPECSKVAVEAAALPGELAAVMSTLENDPAAAQEGLAEIAARVEKSVGSIKIDEDKEKALDLVAAIEGVAAAAADFTAGDSGKANALADSMREFETSREQVMRTCSK